jgi:DNA helicase HerA-like ATPase
MTEVPARTALDLPIGYTFDDDPQAVTVDASRHIHIVGTAGVGKTTLAATLAASARAAGMRVVVLAELDDDRLRSHAHEYIDAQDADAAASVLAAKGGAGRTFVIIDSAAVLAYDSMWERLDGLISAGRDAGVTVVVLSQGTSGAYVDPVRERLRFFMVNTGSVIDLQPNRLSQRDADELGLLGLDVLRTGPTQPGVGVISDAVRDAGVGGRPFRVHSLT